MMIARASVRALATHLPGRLALAALPAHALGPQAALGALVRGRGLPGQLTMHRSRRHFKMYHTSM